MKTIETSYALTALRKMAEYSPERLLKMEKEEPEKLLEEIEIRVTNALGYTNTVIGKGADKKKMQEMMDQLLRPDITSGNNVSTIVSENKINEIYQKLIALA